MSVRARPRRVNRTSAQRRQLASAKSDFLASLVDSEYYYSQAAQGHGRSSLSNSSSSSSSSSSSHSSSKPSPHLFSTCTSAAPRHRNLQHVQRKVPMYGRAAADPLHPPRSYLFQPNSVADNSGVSYPMYNALSSEKPLHCMKHDLWWSPWKSASASISPPRMLHK
jgi:hypothetical protein